MSTIAIIGAGASGMMAALTAAEEPENRVLLFERQARAGRKLLSTGNGRCNLTNEQIDFLRYHGEDPVFPVSVLAKFRWENTLDWFHDRGLLTVTEPSGRVYPLSNSANSVLDVLRLSIEQQENISLRVSEPVLSLRREKNGFLAKTEQETVFADKVIVACGGMAGSKVGGVKDGYTLLQSLGHSRTALYPALVQVTTDPEYPRALKGVRADARVTLMDGSRAIGQAEGEVQFTEKGVSGPAIFDISRAVSTGGEGLALRMDFLRHYGRPQIQKALLQRRVQFPGLPAGELLTGMVHNRLGKMILRCAGETLKVNFKDKTIGEFTRGELNVILTTLKDFPLSVRGTEGFASAQVTAGGIRCSEFDPSTLESRLAPGLFACGEVLDVDGDCGGFNLQWAWSSGRVAGRLGK